MRQIDLVALAREGWVTQHDDVAGADSPFSSDLIHYDPSVLSALKLQTGYERAGVGTDGLGGAIVCLFGATVQDLTSGVDYDCLVYGANAKLYVQELATSESDDLAAGNTVYSFTAGSTTALLGAGADANTYWEHCVYQNQIFVFNGTLPYVIWRDTTWQIDGVDAGLCTDPPPPTAKIPRMYLGRMWTGLDRDLYYSEVSPDT